MIILIKYNDINIQITNNNRVYGDIRRNVDKEQELRGYLYEILYQYSMKYTHTFYLANLYIYNSNNQKSLFNDDTQSHFNEVIQLFIDVKEAHRIHDYNTNKVYLHATFPDSPDRSTTKLITKLMQVYNISKRVEMHLHRSILISEIRKPLADEVYKYIES